MKFLEYLQEEYLSRVTWDPHLSKYPKGFSAEIFIDPTRKELQQIKQIKFIICAKNSNTFIIYVWDGETAVHHSTVMNHLLNNGLWHNFVMMGWGRYDNGKIRNSTSNSELSLNLKNIDIESFKKWLQKHFIMDKLPASLLEDKQ
jgi:hypothetical protein